MKLRFKQRLFSWLDSYDIYDEAGNIYFTVEGKLSWGHEFHIFDSRHNFIGKLKEEVFTFLPKFYIYDENNLYKGHIQKNLTFFKPSFSLHMFQWEVIGNWLELDYEIVKGNIGIAKIKKELWNWTDTYTITTDEENAFYVLLIVLAIDAIKCSRS